MHRFVLILNNIRTTINFKQNILLFLYLNPSRDILSEKIKKMTRTFSDVNLLYTLKQVPSHYKDDDLTVQYSLVNNYRLKLPYLIYDSQFLEYSVSYIYYFSRNLFYINRLFSIKPSKLCVLCNFRLF